MAKKSFSINPAAQFISQSIAEPEEKITEKPQLQQVTEAPPAGYKLNPLYIEKKERRLQLIMQASLYSRIKKTAQNKGLSVNEYVHQVLDANTPPSNA